MFSKSFLHNKVMPVCNDDIILISVIPLRNLYICMLWLFAQSYCSPIFPIFYRFANTLKDLWNFGGQLCFVLLMCLFMLCMLTNVPADSLLGTSLWRVLGRMPPPPYLLLMQILMSPCSKDIKFTRLDMTGNADCHVKIQLIIISFVFT